MKTKMDAVHSKSVDRNPSIDLFRILMAYGIVLLYVSGSGRYAMDFPQNVCCCCVPGFVMISGFFGIRFTVSKLLRLLATSAFCLSLLFVLKMIVAPNGYFAFYPEHWWFLWAYIILMTFGPFVDAVFESRNARKIMAAVCPLLFVVFAWGAATNYNALKHWLPSAGGLGGFSFLTLLAAYILGRMVAVFELDKRLSIRMASGLSLCLLGLMAVSKLYWTHYNNIVCQLAAASLFITFAKIHIPACIERLVRLLAPSTFAVYLFHLVLPLAQNGCEPRAFIIDVTERLNIFNGHCMSAVFVAVAVFVFLVSLALDCPRRLIVNLLCKRLKSFNAWADELYDNVINCLIACAFRMTR